MGDALPGNRNDIIVARATVRLPDGITALTDGAYRSLPGATTPPKNDPAALKAHKKLRARTGHILARMKDRQIRQCRRKGNAINHAARAVACLYNLRFDRIADL